jgi:hypothetical protein
MQRPAESNAGGEEDEKRLGETEEGEEKKPVAAAVAARIAMAPLPSVTLAPSHSSFPPPPVIR